MADMGRKISELPAADALTGTEQISAVQDGSTVKTTVDQIKTYASAGLIPATEKGTAGGVAALDSGGRVPAAQLPSYVDDVVEYASLAAFPATGEAGVIYVALDTNLTYRWSGSEYIRISPSPDPYASAPEMDGIASPGHTGAYARGDHIHPHDASLLPQDTAAGDPVILPDGAADIPVDALDVIIVPIQAGSGTPAVDNIRPISGRTGLTLYHSGADTSSPETYPVSWQDVAGTVYGGSLDAVGGELASDMVLLTLDGTEDWISYQSGSYFYMRIGEYNTVVGDQAICSHLPENPDIASSNNEIGFRAYNRSASSSRMAALLIRFDSTKTQTLEEFAAYLAAQYAAGTPVQVCWRLQTARTYALPATPMRTFRGENRIWADSGTVTAEYRADIALYIDKRLAEIEGANV